MYTTDISERELRNDIEKSTVQDLQSRTNIIGFVIRNNITLFLLYTERFPIKSGMA